MAGPEVGEDRMIGLEGVANGPLDVGVEAIVTSTTGDSAGVLAYDFSSSGIAGFFQAISPSGPTTGVVAFDDSTGGIAGLFEANAATGNTVGIMVTNSSTTGTAGIFNSKGGGNILVGQNNGVNKFRVDGTGRGYFDGGVQASGADFAESVAVRGDRLRYQPGDLLAIDPTGNRRLDLSQEAYSTRVAGIYSTQPGILASTSATDGARLAGEVPLAVVGIVPCKVTAVQHRLGPAGPGRSACRRSQREHRTATVGLPTGRIRFAAADGSGAVEYSARTDRHAWVAVIETLGWPRESVQHGFSPRGPERCRGGQREHGAAECAELDFINDAEFRRTLLVDLDAARSALNNGEWKAATVLGGALVEALLLWAIQKQEQSKIEGAFAARKLQKKSLDPLNWGLHEYVEVAEQLALISPETAKQARLARDFRNLIHPGRTIRSQQTCNRGTALATNAAVELVSLDLHSVSIPGPVG